MFADTLTLTVNGVAKVLTRTGNGEYLLRETTGKYTLKFRHTSYTTKAGVLYARHNIEMVHTVYAAVVGDPDVIRKSYIVLDQPDRDVVADVVYENLAFAAFFTSPNLTKIQNGEV